MLLRILVLNLRYWFKNAKIYGKKPSKGSPIQNECSSQLLYQPISKIVHLKFLLRLSGDEIGVHYKKWL